MMKRGLPAARCAAAVLLSSLVIAFLTEITPAQPSPAEAWPRQVDGRKLYGWEHGFIYARELSAADQVREVLAIVRKDAELDTTAPSAGLVLVVDVQEKYPCEIARLIDVMKKADPNASTKESADGQKAIIDAQEKVKELGLDLAVMLSLVPIPIPPGQLGEIADGFPPDTARQIGWCAIVPTDRCIKASFKRMIDAALKKEKPGLAKRAAIAAMMPLIERKAVGMMKKGRQVSLYTLLLETRKDLSPEQRREKVEAYKEKLGLNEESDPEKDDPNEARAEKKDSR